MTFPRHHLEHTAAPQVSAVTRSPAPGLTATAVTSPSPALLGLLRADQRSSLFRRRLLGAWVGYRVSLQVCLSSMSSVLRPFLSSEPGEKQLDVIPRVVMASEQRGFSPPPHRMIIPITKRRPNNTKTDQLLLGVINGLSRSYHNNTAAKKLYPGCLAHAVSGEYIGSLTSLVVAGAVF